MRINCVNELFLLAFCSFHISFRQVMIVCLCNPVTDSQIRACAMDGCGSFREMAGKLGVAQQCGRCACFAKQVFDAARPVAEDLHFGPVSVS